MTKYRWLLTVKLCGGDLAIAQTTDLAPSPGDLVELENGTIATVVIRSVYTDDEAEYQASTAIVQPQKVVCCYERRPYPEENNDANH